MRNLSRPRIKDLHWQANSYPSGHQWSTALLVLSATCSRMTNSCLRCANLWLLAGSVGKDCVSSNPISFSISLVFLQVDTMRELLEVLTWERCSLGHSGFWSSRLCGLFPSRHRVIFSGPLRGEWKAQIPKDMSMLCGGNRKANKEGTSSLVYLLGQAPPFPVWF